MKLKCRFQRRGKSHVECQASGSAGGVRTSGCCITACTVLTSSCASRPSSSAHRSPPASIHARPSSPMPALLPLSVLPPPPAPIAPAAASFAMGVTVGVAVCCKPSEGVGATAAAGPDAVRHLPPATLAPMLMLMRLHHRGFSLDMSTATKDAAPPGSLAACRRSKGVARERARENARAHVE